MTRLTFRSWIVQAITTALDFGYCYLAARLMLGTDGVWGNALVLYGILLVACVALWLRRVIVIAIAFGACDNLIAPAIAKAMTDAGIPGNFIGLNAQDHLVHVADYEVLPVKTRIAAAILAGILKGTKETGFFRGLMLDLLYQKALAKVSVPWPAEPTITHE